MQLFYSGLCYYNDALDFCDDLFLPITSIKSLLTPLKVSLFSHVSNLLTYFPCEKNPATAKLELNNFTESTAHVNGNIL